MSFPVRQICYRDIRSCIFHPCYWSSRCQVSRFSPLLFVPGLSGLPFSTPAIRSRVVRFCVFHPCYWSSRCQVSRLALLLFVPGLSGIPFSTRAIRFRVVKYCFFLPAIIKVSSCQVSRFQSLRVVCLDWVTAFVAFSCCCLTVCYALLECYRKHPFTVAKDCTIYISLQAQCLKAKALNND